MYKNYEIYHLNLSFFLAPFHHRKIFGTASTIIMLTVLFFMLQRIDIESTENAII